MMNHVETFEHTADLGLRIYAEGMADLFRAAAEGLFGVIVVNLSEVRPLDSESVTLTAEDREELLVAWLSELLYLCETKHRLYCKFDVSVAEDGRSLTATIQGEPIDRDRHILDHEVKAITRHQLSLRREATGWIAEVILDI